MVVPSERRGEKMRWRVPLREQAFKLRFIAAVSFELGAVKVILPAVKRHNLDLPTIRSQLKIFNALSCLSCRGAVWNRGCS